MNKKLILIILDGWGIATNPEVSAIFHAKTPFIDSLYKKYPHSHLEASGLAVGLPSGQMGNSEVGHMNIGAGRVVYQDLVRINLACEDLKNGELAQNQTLKDALNYAKENKKNVHLIGLVSDGGVHSHISHLKALCEITKNNDISNVFVHAFTDGRDTDPKSGLAYLSDLQDFIDKEANNVKIASIIGRYYAMDRDKRWERVRLAYALLTQVEGTKTQDFRKAIQTSYNEGITDEFIKPIVCTNDKNEPLATIQDDDVVICFNFRTDRGREITQVLTQEDFPDFQMHKKHLHYLTITNYDDSFKNVKVLFDKDNLSNTLGEIISKNHKKQIRIAETEKYPHVTFFFSGGQEKPFEGETHILCPSQKVATYDLAPEMSANDIATKICVELDKKEADFVCLNFANADMVGHTGVFAAAVKACETVDTCAQKVVENALRNGYYALIIADHGNSDFMINEDGTPNTAHTTNLVPCILVGDFVENNDNQNIQLNNGKLSNIAPTILEIMGLQKPTEMTEKSLIK